MANAEVFFEVHINMTNIKFAHLKHRLTLAHPSLYTNCIYLHMFEKIFVTITDLSRFECTKKACRDIELSAHLRSETENCKFCPNNNTYLI